ncbi:uncharacterized protein phf11 isoform X1 [Anguilla anguilla]|uniref:uncharacterized protein phf11 isoform X1 n=1 Tax=Anguilla anguilla TaxID=7936 RepID=UPI0015AACAD2|nr:uncharacterized protein phf11 isoform X1 [Anguilla anguilla]XP_035249087.1 uncharacterized protein phf11 isoform X1 [Anguilla anguilla]XP_035249088.1 uncharacterized protein phf11 isoform X1 [Anguilla anguilla]
MKRHRLFCGFCHSSEESEITGPLLNKDDVAAHRNCLFYSSNIVNKNTPDDDDLFGFLPEDVKEEIKRGCRLKCARCKRTGATVGCEVKRCKKSYHYPCAVVDDAKNIEDDDNGIFKIYCKVHKENSDTRKDESESECVVKRKRPRPSPGATARRILDDDSSATDDSLKGIDPELGPLESDLEDSRELRQNSPIPDEPGRDVSEEPKPSTSGTFQHGDAEPPAVAKDKADNSGPDRQERTDRTELTKNREPKVHLVHLRNGDADDTDIDSVSWPCPEKDQESQSILPLNITEVVPITPDHSASVSSLESGAGGTSEAVQFWRRCREAGCVETIFRTFIFAMNTVSEKILSEHASEEECALSLRVLEASGMLPEIFAQIDREYDDRLLSLQREMEAVRKTRSAAKSAAQMKSLN